MDDQTGDTFRCGGSDNPEPLDKEFDGARAQPVGEMEAERPGRPEPCETYLTGLSRAAGEPWLEMPWTTEVRVVDEIARVIWPQLQVVSSGSEFGGMLPDDVEVDFVTNLSWESSEREWAVRCISNRLL